MIITIDGPAGSGKSTAARQVAKALGIAYLDTGATYRAVTLKALREGADMEDEQALADIARRIDLKLLPDPEGVGVILDGQDVSTEIRSAEISEMSYYVARSPAVREVLVELHRRIGAELGSFATEGRDQGTVAFPQADFKFYLDASPEVRAERRCEDMRAAGQQADCQEVLRAILERDRRDRNRQVGPLTRPPGAIDVDTSNNTIEQTRDQILGHLEARR